MDVIEVLNGQVCELEGDYLEREFEADDVTPFPLQAVLTQFHATEILTEDISWDADAMELAVLFSDTFDDSISVKRVKEAQQRADARIEAGEYNCSRRTVVIQELVAAYGRDYAFRKSSFRRQYDAVKWHSAVGLYHFGDWLIETTERVQESVRPYAQAAKARLKDAVRSHLPTRRSDADGDTQVYEPDADDRVPAKAD